MTSNISVPNVSKIAIINPYLLRGLAESSEMEAIARFIVAAKNIGIEAAVFKRSDEIYDFNPDFVIPISHQEPKLTHYPTYGLFNNPIQWVTASARFTRNIFTYDGYFSDSPHLIQWLQKLCAATNKKLHTANAVFSVPKTEFKPVDLSKASAAYLGVNWDGLRHFALFQYFQDGTYLKCYGPRESWIKYPAQLYGGMIPFDGFTALKMYREHGIGLCINHPAMDVEGVPTCRTFEIPASGAVAICSRSPYIEQKFGDSVFYINHHDQTEQLAESIKEKIDWVRSHPKDAQEMARSAHEIFNRELSMEHFIQNMVKMHHEVIRENGFIKDDREPSKSSTGTAKPSAAPKITYLVYVDHIESISRLIKNIQTQTYGDVRILLLFNKDKINESNIRPYLNHFVSALHYEGAHSNEVIFKFLIDSKTEWFGILKDEDKLFDNHCAMLMKAYETSPHDKNKESVAIVFGNSLEHAKSADLKDKIQDHFMLYLTNEVRIGNITPCAEIPLCATLFKLNQDFLMAFKASDFRTNLRLDFATSVEPLEVAIHSNEITCSAIVNDKPAVFVVHNATSPFNFPSNLHYANGKLLIDERQRQKMSLEQAEIENKIPSIAAKKIDPQTDYQKTIDRIIYKPCEPSINSKVYSHPVAIILRTKDRPICIPRAMNSILNQTFKDWQLVIVNDGGNVQSFENSLRPFLNAVGNRLTVINNPQSLGMSRGLNLAIDASDSEFIVVHDDDDSWHPDFLIQTVKFLKDSNNTDCGGVITHSMRVIEEIHGNNIVERLRNDFNSQDNLFTRISFYRLLMQNTFPPISFLFRRSVVDKIGYFNEDLPVLNDWDFNIRCLFHYEIGVIPQHLAYYHHRPNQQNGIYGNSIIATSNLCLQYEAVIRNRSLRMMLNSDNHAPLLGMIMALGGQDLFNVSMPEKVDKTYQIVQQIPGWMKQNIYSPLAEDINKISKQFHELNNKLDNLLQRQKKLENIVNEPA